MSRVDDDAGCLASRGGAARITPVDDDAERSDEEEWRT
jgi:hypothetical protein